MQNKFEHIIFDLDGTIADSQPGIVNAVNYAFDELGVQDISVEDIKVHMGIPLQDYFDLLNKLTKTPCDVDEAVKKFRVYYKEKGVFESQIYPGMQQLLGTLYKTRNLYVATAKYIVFARQMLENEGLIDLFQDIIGADYGGTHALKTDLVADIMKNNGIPSGNRSVMIGDKHMDIEAGHANNIQTIAIEYGFGSKEELVNCKPHYSVSNVDQLADLLL